MALSSNISNIRKSVSSGYPNPEKWVEKTRCSQVFLTDFKVFRYLMKHSFEFLIWFLKPFIILGEIQSKSSQKFMLIRIRYPNHFVSLYELLMSLRSRFHSLLRHEDDKVVVTEKYLSKQIKTCIFGWLQQS